MSHRMNCHTGWMKMWTSCLRHKYYFLISNLFSYSKLSFYGKYTFTISWILKRHNGQLFKDAVQYLQTNKWPHGKNNILGSLSLQILQMWIFFKFSEMSSLWLSFLKHFPKKSIIFFFSILNEDLYIKHELIILEKELLEKISILLLNIFTYPQSG